MQMWLERPIEIVNELYHSPRDRLGSHFYEIGPDAGKLFIDRGSEYLQPTFEMHWQKRGLCV